MFLLFPVLSFFPQSSSSFWDFWFRSCARVRSIASISMASSVGLPATPSNLNMFTSTFHRAGRLDQSQNSTLDFQPLLEVMLYRTNYGLYTTKTSSTNCSTILFNGLGSLGITHIWDWYSSSRLGSSRTEPQIRYDWTRRFGTYITVSNRSPNLRYGTTGCLQGHQLEATWTLQSTLENGT